MIKINVPLIVNKKDSKWQLLGKIIDLISSRKVKLEIAKHSIKPIIMAGVVFRVTLIAIFFSEDISYVVEEIKRRKELQLFSRVPNPPRAIEIYRFLSRFSEKQFVSFVCSVLSTICLKRGRNNTLIVDSTDISLDINWFRKRIKKADLKEREFKWGYSPSKGYYIGYKLTLAIEYPNLRPVAVLLHQGSPNDCKIYEIILEELKRRRIARNGSTIIFDRGYYSYKNYLIGVSRFKIVPLIFAKKNFNMEKLMGLLSYPLSIFEHSNLEKEKQFYNRITKSLKAKLENWKKYRSIRGMIEDVFKLAKNSFSLTKLHRYTKRAVQKFVCLNVLLIGILVSLGIRSKEEIQKIAEW